MENLNNLIWTDEDDDNGNDIQLQGEGDMKERCIVAFCTITGGSCYACSPIDAVLSTAPAVCSLG
jgi:hypothetical protein